MESQFASARVSFKPAVNILERLECCPMLSVFQSFSPFLFPHCTRVSCAVLARAVSNIQTLSLFTGDVSPKKLPNESSLLLTLLHLLAPLSIPLLSFLSDSPSNSLSSLSAVNPNACRATGRGLQPKGVRVKEVADFKVFTKGAGSGELKVSVKGPSESDLFLFSLSLGFPQYLRVMHQSVNPVSYLHFYAD